MEFHVPYMAVRDKLELDPRYMTVQDKLKVAPRRLRTSYEMLETLEMEAKHTENDSFYHQAQISFLLTGVDEWHWTAYCCVDTYFGSEKDPEWYLSRHFDGPPGGGQLEFLPIWNPREYFLLVFTRRLNQATKEWTNAILKLESRLNEYV